MGRKVRRQVTLDEQQDAVLRQTARELGISAAEVIRRGIELVQERKTGDTPARPVEEPDTVPDFEVSDTVKEALAKLSPEERRQWEEQQRQFWAEIQTILAEARRKNPNDPDLERRLQSLEEHMDFIRRERMIPGLPNTGRGWTREELYDERLDRYSH